MSYVYYFEVAAAAVLLIVLYDMLTKKQYYRDDAKIFIKAAVSQIALSLTDVLSCILLANKDTVPLALNILVILAYFTLQAMVLFYITMFPQAYNSHRTIKKSKNYVGAVILCVVNVCIAFSSLGTKAYFYFDADNSYHQGELAELGYLFYGVMAVIVFVYALMPKHKYLLGERLSMLGAMAIIAIGVQLQYSNKSYLIMGLTTAIALLLIYVSMENPNSYIDKGTGAGNHEAIKRRMESWKMSEDRYAFVTVRIDNLKHFDSYMEADKSEDIIARLAEFLKSHLKNRRNVYRLDDNSVTMIIPGGVYEVSNLYEELENLEKAAIKDKDSEFSKIEYSVAACVYPMHVRNYDSFRAVTDYLLNEISGSVSRHSIIADDDVLKKLERADQVEQALDKALKNDTLDLFFQPIYDTREKKITSLEALSRLTDPELGSVSPSEFIKVAERSGRIVELTQRQFEKICIFINDHLKGPDCTIENVNVNLSPILLNRQEMVPWLIDKMQAYNIPVGMIDFEITESATADSPEILAIAIKQLMDAGAIFSLDDYGTGYSNILYMANFPFVSIKFDRELIWSYFTQDVFRTILNKEFELVQQLKENIVAEGVETEEQLNALVKKGIRYIQGYYFSSPLSEERILEYLNAPAPAKWFAEERVAEKEA